MKLTASFTLLLAVVLQASSVASDSCTVIAGQSYVVPSHALACLKSFPHNETIKDNVMSNVERVMDFYTFESYYLDSPPPFQESTIQIRSEFSRIRKTTYQVGFISAACDVVSQISVCSRTMIFTGTCTTSPSR